MSFSAALEKLQESIIEGDPQVALALIKTRGRLSAQERLNIYIDAYLLRLCKTVQSDYPCLAAYWGQERMNKFVEVFAKETPSYCYNLDFYPIGFSSYLKQTDVSIEIRELAELESAIAEVFMLSGSKALSARDLATFNLDEVEEKIFTLRPASRLLAFTHDVETTLQTFKRGEPIREIMPCQTYLYVYRHENEVKRRRLEKTEHQLLMQIASRKTLGAAIEAVFETSNETEENFMLRTIEFMQHWISEGLFAHEPCNHPSANHE